MPMQSKDPMHFEYPAMSWKGVSLYDLRQFRGNALMHHGRFMRVGILRLRIRFAFAKLMLRSG
jgi:hypothetical protein